MAAFKGRMGTSRGINMGFDLKSLLQPMPGLEAVTKPFTVEEMDNVVKHMLVDKAPRPNGFNGLFFQKMWHISDPTRANFYFSEFFYQAI